MAFVVFLLGKVLGNKTKKGINEGCFELNKKEGSMKSSIFIERKNIMINIIFEEIIVYVVCYLENIDYQNQKLADK